MREFLPDFSYLPKFSLFAAAFVLYGMTVLQSNECRSSNVSRYIKTIQISIDLKELDLDSDLITLESTPPDLIEEEIWADSVEYLACCVEAEAGNQTELGKRLVCDTIINRYKSGGYENFYDVINESGQYSVVEDGRIYTIVPTERTYQIVSQELERCTNQEVLYFRTEHYHTFGIPLLCEGDHYFSK